MKRQGLIFFLLFASSAFGQNITTIAGTGSSSYSGSGVPATSAGIPDAIGGTFDKYGNYYFADGLGGNRIRKIDASGIITTVAGGGIAFADGVAATVSSLNQPQAVRLDTFGNLYIADAGNMRIRKVDKSTGIISTIAGTGAHGFSGDNGPATAAMIQDPNDICFDKFGNLYIADLSNFRIRKVDKFGVITTFAGCACVGPIGDGGPATAALLNVPQGLAVDDTGNIYIADASTNRVRKVNTLGIISTIAGNGTGTYLGDGMLATNAQINPIKLAFDTSGELFIADDGNARVYKIDNSGILRLVAGNGVTTFAGDGSPATAASFNYPGGVSFDACDNLYITDVGNRRIRKVTYNPACDPYRDGSNSDSVSLSVPVTLQYIVSVFPNPVMSSFTVESANKINQITITNLIGQIVYNQNANVKKKEIDVARLASGIYFVKVTDAEGRKLITKIIKQ